MRNWKEYYATRPAMVGHKNYLSQVGHTVHGQPIGESQFQSLSKQIAATLDLKASDTVLDLCCGNGLFSHMLASRVRAVVGVDFTEELLAVAREDHSADNIRYIQCDARHIGSLHTEFEEPFSKAMIYASLQHFCPSEFETILDSILAISSDRPLILLGFVPDRDRRWRFYRTLRQRLNFLARSITSNDNFGHWWRKTDIEKIASRRGFECKFDDLPGTLHASRYRFNVLLSPSHGASPDPLEDQ